MRRRITTVLEETISTRNQVESEFQGNTQSTIHTGTAPYENTPTPSNTKSAMPVVVTSKQPAYLTATDPVAEQPSSSSSTTPSGGELTSPAGRDLSIGSVSVRKKGRYEAHDKVDQYLLLQVCRHVQTDTLELLAEYLGISPEQYVDTRTNQPANPRAQIMKVCIGRNLKEQSYTITFYIKEIQVIF